MHGHRWLLRLELRLSHEHILNELLWPPVATGSNRCIKQTHIDSAVCSREQSSCAANRWALRLTNASWCRPDHSGLQRTEKPFQECMELRAWVNDACEHLKSDVFSRVSASRIRVNHEGWFAHLLQPCAAVASALVVGFHLFKGIIPHPLSSNAHFNGASLLLFFPM